MKFLILAFLLLISLQLVYTTPEADEDKVDESLVANIPGDWYSGYLKAGQGDKYLYIIGSLLWKKIMVLMTLILPLPYYYGLIMVLGVVVCMKLLMEMDHSFSIKKY